MGSSSSQSRAATQEPVPTTVTARTTVSASTVTSHSPVYTSAADSRAAEVQCFIDHPEIIYMLLAYISGVLSSVLLFAVVYLIKKMRKRPQENLQKQTPPQKARETSAGNGQPQDEVTYASLVLQQSVTPRAVS